MNKPRSAIEHLLSPIVDAQRLVMARTHGHKIVRLFLDGVQIAQLPIETTPASLLEVDFRDD